MICLCWKDDDGRRETNQTETGGGGSVEFTSSRGYDEDHKRPLSFSLALRGAFKESVTHQQ